MTEGTTERATDLFVDAVEAGRARLLLGEEAFSVPAALLPEGAREGSWIRLGATVIPPPSDPDRLRRKLGGDDPGGPIEAVSGRLVPRVTCARARGRIRRTIISLDSLDREPA